MLLISFNHRYYLLLLQFIDDVLIDQLCTWGVVIGI